MIKLTLMDETEILVNTDQIETISADEQSTIRFKNGKKIMVKESSGTILSLIKSLTHRDQSCQ